MFLHLIVCCVSSVFAEAYNPEEDDGDDTKVDIAGGPSDPCQVVHPKTDEQRQRLQERVQSQLLFRTLDQDQLIEVSCWSVAWCNPLP